MKKIILAALLLVCMQAYVYAKSETQSLNSIVAVVNDEVVTHTELSRALGIIKSQMAQANVNIPSEGVLRKQALNKLIDKKLQIQIARQVGINITDEEIDRVIQNVADKNNMSVESLYKHINQDGMSTTVYRNEMREQMTIQKIQQQEVAGHLTVTPDEIDRFIHSKVWQSNTNKEYHLEDILIPLSDIPSSEEVQSARQRAKVVLTKLNQGESFNHLEQSLGDTNIRSDDLGWRKLPEIPSAFSQHIVSLQPKEIAGPIQTANGFHLIRLTALRSSGEKVAAPNRTQVEQFLMQRKFEENVQNWVSKIRSQAFISMK